MEMLKGEYTVSEMCRCLYISLVALYSWRRAHHCRDARTKEKKKRMTTIRQSHHASRNAGGPGTLDRRESGGHLVRRVVNTLKLASRLSGDPQNRLKVTPGTTHGEELILNQLNRNFTSKAPNHAWVVDITDRRNSGWQYLATVSHLHNLMVCPCKNHILGQNFIRRGS